MAGALIGVALLAVLLTWGTPLQQIAMVNAGASVLANGARPHLFSRTRRRTWAAVLSVVTAAASIALVFSAWSG
jgi:ribose 1,5-bisphosphokinase PhnN